MIERNFFEVIVVGEQPNNIIKEYDKNIKTKPYIVYKFEDAEYLKSKTVDMYNGLLFSGNFSDEEKEEIKENRNEVLNSSAEDFFFEILTFDYKHDNDGNAISTENKKGKYSVCQEGKLFSIPFITKDGREVFQAKKGEINWNLMHLNNKNV